MDNKDSSYRPVMPGISIRNGPLNETDMPIADMNGDQVNGNGPQKRKVRGRITGPSYAEEESSTDDDKPLVRAILP